MTLNVIHVYKFYKRLTLQDANQTGVSQAHRLKLISHT